MSKTVVRSQLKQYGVIFKKRERQSIRFFIQQSDNKVLTERCPFFSGRVRSWRRFLRLWCVSDFGGNSSSSTGVYSAELSKTVFHLQSQLFPRQLSQTPCTEQLDEGMVPCADDQQTSKSIVTTTTTTTTYLAPTYRTLYS